MHLHRHLLRATMVALLAVVAAAPLRAQDDFEDYIAYFAVLTTPKGGLSPLAPANARSALMVRWGRNEVFDLDADDEEAFDNFGITFSPRVGMGRLDLTIGALTCQGCESNVLGEVGYEGTLVSAPFGAGSLSFGLRPAIGFGRSLDSDVDGYSLSLSGEVPMAMNVSAGPIGRLTLFLTPGFAWGRLAEDGDSVDGTRPMLSGGVHVGTVGGFGLTAGVQKVFVDEGKATLGVGVSIPLGGR